MNDYTYEKEYIKKLLVGSRMCEVTYGEDFYLLFYTDSNEHFGRMDFKLGIDGTYWFGDRDEWNEKMNKQADSKEDWDELTDCWFAFALAKLKYWNLITIENVEFTDDYMCITFEGGNKMCISTMHGYDFAFCIEEMSEGPANENLYIECCGGCFMVDEGRKVADKKLMEWMRVKTEQDVMELNRIYDNFEDSFMVSFTMNTGNYVDEDRVGYEHDNNILTMKFERLDDNPFSIELRFVHTRKINYILPVCGVDNWAAELSFAKVAKNDEFFYWTVWSEFDPYNSKHLEYNDLVFVEAKLLEWRILE